MGFSVGLKNDLSQADTLQPYFDFAINEQCFQYDECAGFQSWPSQYGKAVFNVEYDEPSRPLLPEGELGGVRLQLDREDRRPVRPPRTGPAADPAYAHMSICGSPAALSVSFSSAQ